MAKPFVKLHEKNDVRYIVAYRPTCIRYTSVLTDTFDK